MMARAVNGRVLRKPVPQQDPRQPEIISRSVDNFREACQLFDSPVEFLEVPFEDDDATLPAHLFLPKDSPKGDSRGKIPVAVQVQGYDTTKEECYHFTAAGALPWGYAVLIFDAPGQSIVARREIARREKHQLPLRVDLDVVIKAVLDGLWAHAASSPTCRCLDLEQVALLVNPMSA
ncbi:hypothetical protein EKO27_g9337 [Xylaria grammica]|uniref:Uncharacterized protein n=1 Tax=Xylaria grammica TaxID=363999 RepID=A0A439CUE4_9PEZI|nr:hypothetical protein EKO27_g9337 [Xylaria grammica]